LQTFTFPLHFTSSCTVINLVSNTTIWYSNKLNGINSSITPGTKTIPHLAEVLTVTTVFPTLMLLWITSENVSMYGISFITASCISRKNWLEKVNPLKIKTILIYTLVIDLQLRSSWGIAFLQCWRGYGGWLPIWGAWGIPEYASIEGKSNCGYEGQGQRQSQCRRVYVQDCSRWLQCTSNCWELFGLGATTLLWWNGNSKR